MLNYCVNNISLHWNSQYYVGIYTYQTIEFHERCKSILELKLKAMSSIQIHVYYLIFWNKLFVNNFLISN